MSLVRVNTAGWSVLDKLTSAQINAIDISLTYALDKRAGFTDTLGSVVVASLAGRIIGSALTGADADTTYTVAQGIGTILPGTLTAARTYTLSVAGAIAGDMVTLNAGPSFNATVRDASGALIGVVGPQGLDWLEARFNGVAWTLFCSGKVITASTPLVFAVRSLMINN